MYRLMKRLFEGENRVLAISMQVFCEDETVKQYQWSSDHRNRTAAPIQMKPAIISLSKEASRIQ